MHTIFSDADSGLVSADSSDSTSAALELLKSEILALNESTSPNKQPEPEQIGKAIQFPHYSNISNCLTI